MSALAEAGLGGRAVNLKAPSDSALLRISKRAKKAAADAEPAKALEAQNFNLLELSSDLIDLVLSFTHPSALVRLVWTCKRLAAKLLSNKSASIWIAARLFHSQFGIGIPACPEDVSELRWAYLLFGLHECNTCGETDVHKIIFPFRRRVCAKCAKDNYSRLKTTCSPLCFLCFHTSTRGRRSLLQNSGDGSVGWNEGERCIAPEIHPVCLLPSLLPPSLPQQPLVKIYWRPDVEDMFERFPMLDFDKRRTFVSKIVVDAEEQVAWATRVFGGQDDVEPNAEEEALMNAHVKYVQAKYLADGWGPIVSQLDGSQWLSGPPARVELCAEKWEELDKSLEPKLRAMDAEWMSTTRRNRPTVLRQIFIQIMKKLPPEAWYIAPSFVDVRDALEAWNLRATETELEEEVAIWCDAWSDEALFRHLGSPSEEHEMERFEELHLATVVYICPCPDTWCGGRQTAPTIGDVTPKDGLVPFCGLREAMLHERRHREMPILPNEPKKKVELQVNVRGSKAAAAILEVVSARLGIELRGERPQDVDKALRAVRFVCETCLEKDPHGLGRVVMDWRRCISHFLEFSETEHPKPEFTVVENVSGLPSVRQKDFNARKLSHDWACILCDVDCFDWKPLDAVLKHIRQKHPEAGSPAEEEHYVWAGSTPRPLALPLVSGTTVPKKKGGPRQERPVDKRQFSCVKCDNLKAKKKRKFESVAAVKDHLLDVHKVLKPFAKDDIHFKCLVREM